MNVVQNSPRPQAAAAPVCRPPAERPTVAQDNTRVAKPRIDSSVLSATPQKENPYSSFAESSTSVKVDGWKKGKNDSLEGILKNQGYTLKEIYTKDENGKSMVDKVAAANNLRNPNVIHPGQELNVPKKADSESLSSKDLSNGTQQSASVDTGKVSIDAKMEKDQAGTTTATTTTNAGDASHSSKTTVSKDGRADTAVYREGDSVKAQTVAISGDSSAISQVDTATKPGSSSTTVRDIDSNKNLEVTADNNNVRVNNGAKTKGDDVGTNVDISESSSDGWFENTGRGIYNFFTGTKEEAKSVNVSGASEVNVTKNDKGQATVSARVNGEEKVLLQTAGDTDDSWLEKAGEGVDNFFSGIGSFFTGNKEGTSKSQVTKN